MNEEEELVIEDNLEMAMDDVAKSIRPTRKPKTGASEGETAGKQVLLRATEQDHIRWKAAAEKRGVSMAEFIRDAVNSAVRDVLDCPHPSNMKRFFPWATTCLQCGEKWIHDKKKPRAERGG
jgi:hypothetical protein